MDVSLTTTVSVAVICLVVGIIAGIVWDRYFS